MRHFHLKYSPIVCAHGDCRRFFFGQPTSKLSTGHVQSNRQDSPYTHSQEFLLNWAESNFAYQIFRSVAILRVKWPKRSTVPDPGLLEMLLCTPIGSGQERKKEREKKTPGLDQRMPQIN